MRTSPLSTIWSFLGRNLPRSTVMRRKATSTFGIDLRAIYAPETKFPTRRSAEIKL